MNVTRRLGCDEFVYLVDMDGHQEKHYLEGDLDIIANRLDNDKFSIQRRQPIFRNEDNSLMIITDNWTFIHIPRTGGVSFKLAYLDSLGFNKMSTTHNIYECQWMLRPVNEGLHDEAPMNTFGSEHALVNHWESWIPENSQLFTIVRNPYDRFQSICRRGYDISRTIR